ncbi:uncharacterized mitochondrial protein AtMg00860-like [Juglans microcarpa x Juglans regia]|uniref:uncharacterized mitochondrial protein AtMg00860-like n=1 Tax=Juglans microcarpa x Juglans regia TaxID=2249226 RepID=UPI001B7E05C5|nr:uncharacterized mitochondrial protein AtMg00860-like [Juglans microcarpa x Juglans regia]
MSKCKFGASVIEYLGHIISGKGVQADPSKTLAMVQWPSPKTLKSLRGFLGLTSYYKKFIRHYGSIAAPLTSLLKKNSFHWDEAVAVAFEALKKAVSNPPVLNLPEFSKTFIIECDVSSIGMGAVLMQEGHPIAFYNKALKGPLMRESYLLLSLQ